MYLCMCVYNVLEAFFFNFIYCMRAMVFVCTIIRYSARLLREKKNIYFISCICRTCVLCWLSLIDTILHNGRVQCSSSARRRRIAFRRTCAFVWFFFCVCGRATSKAHPQTCYFVSLSFIINKFEKYM